MSSIPLELLMKIEEERPDLARLIHDLMATDDPSFELSLEKRLATAYLSGHAGLTPEETLDLSACVSGRRYGDIDRSRLH
jgi:hypothetical protein